MFQEPLIVKQENIHCTVRLSAKVYELTGKQAYLEVTQLGYRYYIKELLELGYTTASALDTYCVDKESSISLLKA